MGRRLENLIGKRFAYLKAIHPEKLGGKIMWLCECKCGKLIYVETKYLKSGRIRSCGCMNYKEGKLGASPAKCRAMQNLANNINCYKDTQITAIDTSKNAPGKKGMSGVRGVTWDKEAGKWKATIICQRKNHFLGRFDSLQEAAEARAKAEDKYYLPLIKEYSRKSDKIRQKSRLQYEKEVSEIAKREYEERLANAHQMRKMRQEGRQRKVIEQKREAINAQIRNEQSKRF